jgi:hypothetical protein
MLDVSHETTEWGCPSHGRGRRFDPCIAHHSAAAASYLKYKEKSDQLRENPVGSRPTVFGTIRRTTAEHGTGARAQFGRDVLCLFPAPFTTQETEMSEKEPGQLAYEAWMHARYFEPDLRWEAELRISRQRHAAVESAIRALGSKKDG